MIDSELQAHILASLRDLAAKIDAHSTESRTRVNELRAHIDTRIDNLREEKCKDHDQINSRIGTVETKQAMQEATVKGAWKVIITISSGIGLAGGWLISLFGKN